MSSLKRTFSEAVADNFKLDQESNNLSNSYKSIKLENVSHDIVLQGKEEVEEYDDMIEDNTHGSIQEISGNENNDLILQFKEEAQEDNQNGDENSYQNSLGMKDNKNNNVVLQIKEEVVEVDQIVDSSHRCCTELIEINESNTALLEVKEETACHDEVLDNNTGKSIQVIEEDHEIFKLHCCYPQKLMHFNYTLDLYTLWMVRKSVFLCKYPKLHINLSRVVSRQGRLVLGHMMLTVNGRNTIAHIENTDSFYQVDSINYGKLFARQNSTFSIYRFYNGFVKYICQHPFSIGAIKNLDYIIIYTNAGLELTTDLCLKDARSIMFHPYKFLQLDCDLEQNKLIKDFFYTNRRVEGREFLKFLLEGASRQYFLKNLILSDSTLQEMKRAQINTKYEQILQETFIKKLVFAVKQPNREELNSIVKEEINQYNAAQKDYLKLKKLVLENIDMTAAHIHGIKKEKGVIAFGSESQISIKQHNFNATPAMYLLHALFQHKGFEKLKIVKNITTGPYNLLFTFKHRNIYLSFETYNQKNSSHAKQHTLEQCLSRLFKFYIEARNCEIRYFVIYTDFYIQNLSLTSVDASKKKYDFLKYCGLIETKNTFKIARENIDYAEFIILPNSFEESLLNESGSLKDLQSLRFEFVNKLIFAIAQPPELMLQEHLLSAVKGACKTKSVPYTYSELEEISHRVLNTCPLEPITKTYIDCIIQESQGTQNMDQEKLAQCIIHENNLFAQLSKDQHNFFLTRLFNQLNQSSKLRSTSAILNESLNGTNVNQLNYISLQAYVMQCLTAGQEHKVNLSENLFHTIYEHNLVLSALHTLYTNNHMWAVNFIENRRDSSSRSNLVLNYKNRLTYLIPRCSELNISFKMLLPAKTLRGSFALNEYFATYLEAMEYKIPLRYIVIHTNAGLVFDEDLRMRNELGEEAHPFQFEILDGSKKKYKVLSACSFIDIQHLYQFANDQDSMTDLFNALTAGRHEENYTGEELFTLKKDFVKKLIFATRQPNKKILHSNILSEVRAAKDCKSVPYSFEELLEVALRWLEHHVSSSITKSQMDLFLNDVHIKKSSVQKFEIANIENVLAFVKSLAGKEGSFAYEELLNCIVHEGRLNILERHNISLSCFSVMLGKNLYTKSTSAFKEIFELWFDSEGQKTFYLTTLEESRIRLSSITTILHKSGAHCAKTFKELFDLWFNTEREKSPYLTVLEKNKISVRHLCDILAGSRKHAASAYRDLFTLLFDDADGNKSRYLKTLDDNKIRFMIMVSFCGKSGKHAAKSFKNLFDLWFDANGKETFYLQTIRREGIKLSNLSDIFHNCGKSAKKLFKRLFHLWFDGTGNETFYLRILKREGITFSTVFGFLENSGKNARETFIEAFNLWFDEEGNRTHYLEVLNRAGLQLSVVTDIVKSAGKFASKIYKQIIDLWFNKEGKKRRCIRRLESHGITILHLSSILAESGYHAPKAFKALYSAFIDDDDGGKKPFLMHFLDQEIEEERFSVDDLSTLFYNIGAKPDITFEQFHNACYNSEGEPTAFLSDLYSLGLKPHHLARILRNKRKPTVCDITVLHNFYFNNNTSESSRKKQLFEIERRLLDEENLG